ncbi:hypothetical protein BDF14DRAFT_1743578 [Spinellus fusiger]|nr:hypothetical protein BDF14DRAFT_1743578 [Spinellus fusiger]
MPRIRTHSSPSTAYDIIDIHTLDTAGPQKILEGERSQKAYQDQPPSPPASTHFTDAFKSTTLADTIIESLEKPVHQKSIPTFVLYDNRGLRLFDEITYQPEYYLTNAEINILEKQANALADRLQQGSVLIELGSGALRKTQLILKAIEEKCIHITYYALDLDQSELQRSLSNLGEFKYIKCVGLLGTYDQGIPWLSQHFANSNKITHKVVLWLGSSIGNQSRYESAIFLHRLQRTCLQPGDLCLIGFDQRNDPAKIHAAYNDRQLRTHEFIMNGLDHVNTILKQEVFDRTLFDYDSKYQVEEGRHVAHYCVKQDMTLTYHHSKRGLVQIPMKRGEFIHIEQSYKYSYEEIAAILHIAGLDILECWVDDKNQYRLVLSECRAFTLKLHEEAVNSLSKLNSSNESIDCTICQQDRDASYNMEIRERLQANMESKYWPSNIPSLYEWQQLWKAWDTVVGMITHTPGMLHENPIYLRHPFIFYLGHIPAFLDIQLSRNQVDMAIHPGSKLTEPVWFAEIFERGIDPDLEDITVCNPHSKVPTQESDWPSLEAIINYKKVVCHRLERLLLEWESEFYQSQDWPASVTRKAVRVMNMTFEHEAMHLETLLYMIVQSPCIPTMSRPLAMHQPDWKMTETSSAYARHLPQHTVGLDPSPMVSIASGTVLMGIDGGESDDDKCNREEGVLPPTTPIGWDIESPSREVSVNAFRIQTRQVTNGEYLAYLKATHASPPVSWYLMNSELTLFGVRTVYGVCPMHYCLHWPVQVSAVEAEAYAAYNNKRLPTEPELLCFRSFQSTMSQEKQKMSNIGFSSWTPTLLNNTQIQVVGDLWDWSSTLLQAHEGYTPSLIYPGYSSDFFDNKHRMIVGGSWATHPRLVQRMSFRNWYQSGYPYVFAGFRLCE